MTEYICEAIGKGYARERVLVNGKAIICNSPECPGKYQTKIHIDAEPENICLVDGRIPEREKSLIQKVQSTSKITIDLR
ncbi:MAG: hypothetical protein ABIH28_00675 [archaeon]